MNLSKLDAQDYMKIASTGFAVYTVVSTIRNARNDDDGLQLLEGVLRGATLALSLAIIVRNLRHVDDDQALEA
jgi:chorismate synthase